MPDSVAFFFFGLVVLVAGAELLTRGLGWLARAFGDGNPVDFFVIGAASSAAPVLALCLALGLSGSPRAALVTVIGCNIANVGLVLGLAAFIRPVAARLGILRPGIVVLIAATLLVWFLARDHVVSQLDGTWLLIAAGLVAALVLRRAGGQPLPGPTGPPRAGAGLGWAGGVLLLVGVIGLTGGGALVVRSLPALSLRTGQDEVVIVLTVIVPFVALRALAAGVTAARRGEGDAVLGGVVGAGVLNLLLGVGLVAVVRPIGVPEQLLMNELPALALFTLLLIPVLANGLRVRRWEGGVLLVAFAAFAIWQTQAVR